METMESCVPPGFRFHPTEEELVGYYLKRKINSLKINLDIIVDIDLYNMEPWDIEERCKSLGCEEQKEWYFFSHKDRKYPTGTRTNRATAHGFWKATGRDKAVLSRNRIIGMRKTLVFYRGRAPNGRKTDWIMHEYRLQTSEYAPPQEEGWVVCRAFKKPIPSDRIGYEAWNHAVYRHTMNQNLARPQPTADHTQITTDHDLSLLQHSTDFQQVLSNTQLMTEALPPLSDSPPTVSDNRSMNKLIVTPQNKPDLTCEDYELDDDWKTLNSLLAPEVLLIQDNSNGGSSLLPWE